MTIGVQDPDRDAVALAGGGDAEAFERIVVRYQRRIYALAYRYVLDREEASDLTQEIFIRAWKNLASFRGDSKFSTWLFQIAGNHCKNKLKYMRRRHYKEHESLESASANQDDAPMHQHADPGPSPEEDIGNSELHVLLRRFLDELPEEQRIVLVMRDVEDLDYDEISDATGIPLGTVKSRIHRGRLELAKKLKSARVMGS